MAIKALEYHMPTNLDSLHDAVDEYVHNEWTRHRLGLLAFLIRIGGSYFMWVDVTDAKLNPLQPAMDLHTDELTRLRDWGVIGQEEYDSLVTNFPDRSHHDSQIEQDRVELLGDPSRSRYLYTSEERAAKLSI